MRLVALLRCRIAPLLSAAAIALPVSAASNLLENSPFLPPNASGAGAARETAPLELRSIIKTGGNYEFSLYDTARRQSTWARLNETGHDFLVKAYDADQETVTVEQQNRTYKLTLKEAKIVPLNMMPVPNQPASIATVQSTTAPAGARNQPGTATAADRNQGPPGSPPTLTPEQLRNLEADINRRRELRRQAAASLAQPSQPQPASPQPQRR